MPTETIQTPADANDFAEYKAFKTAAASPAVKPAQPSESNNAPSEPKAVKPEGESAAASEAAVTQEAPKGKEKRSDAETTIRTLKAKIAEQERIIAARAEPPAQARVEPPVVAAQTPASDDPKPTRKETLAKLAQEFPSDTYEELLDRFDAKVVDWQAKRDEQQRTERQRQEQRQSRDKIVNEVRLKHPDIDAVLFNTQTLQVKPLAVQYLIDLGVEGLSIGYEVAKNPAEAARIAGLSAPEQLHELVSIRQRLSQNGTPPEKPQTPSARPVFVSRAAAPPRSLNGIEPESSTVARSYSEYKSNKKRA